MNKAYTITEEQLQLALFGIETNQALLRYMNSEKLSNIKLYEHRANLKGNISGIVVTLCLLGFGEEVKQALCECNAAGDGLPGEEEGENNA